MHFFAPLRCIFSYNKLDNLNFFYKFISYTTYLTKDHRLNFHLALVCQNMQKWVL